jgi:hypothetical protein
VVAIQLLPRMSALRCLICSQNRALSARSVKSDTIRFFATRNRRRKSRYRALPDRLILSRSEGRVGFTINE